MAAISRSVKTVTSLFRTRPKQVGLPPGSLVHVGRQEMERPVISRVDYDPTDYRYRQEISVADSAAEAQPGGVCWVQLDGLHDISLVETLGRLVDLHPLALEDILNTSHQPKLEEFPQSLLIILKLLEYDQDQQHIKAEQCSLVVSAGRLLSFREQSGDLFSPIYRRLENASGRFRERGSDYLAYTLIDSAVDSYFHVLETIGDQLEAIEEELITRPSEELLQQIHQLRGQLVFVRKAAAPLRDLVGGL
ncbi:MAG: CorA family divalent cation transporter, partial [Pelovirga sp.]